MTEAKSNGALRLRCDVDDCDRKFVPLRPYTDARQLRKRAELFSWAFSFGRDLCPDHRPQTLDLGGKRS